ASIAFIDICLPTLIKLSKVKKLDEATLIIIKIITSPTAALPCPAFDCPILFNYKPNAVLIGFLVAMLTSTAMILICNYFNVFNL
ncbi:PTS transporter subunit IIC, partial [Clostridioides difficile]